MCRAIWEANAIASRAGYRGSMADELQKRASDRRLARMAADFERETRK